MAELNSMGDNWRAEIYALLKASGITQVAYVPDAGHAHMIDAARADPEMHAIVLTTEEEGIAVAAGADLGGARCVMLMQSSGVGNCINMLSLTKGCRFPLLMVISMRGDFGEGNAWQFAMGQAVEPTLSAMGVICLKVTDKAEVVATMEAAISMVWNAGQSVAVILGQKLLGAKRM